MSLTYTFSRSDQTIGFGTNLDDDDILESLAFVLLIEMKFRAERRNAHAYISPNGERLVTMRLRFDSLMQHLSAEDHTMNKLDQSGRVVPDYVGALSHADPKFRATKALQGKLLVDVGSAP